MFLKKYCPKTLEEMVGNKKQTEEIIRYLGKKPILIYGHPGVGKTLSCYLIAKKLGYNLYEINASDYRDAESLKKVLEIAKQKSLFGNKRIILIDEIDGLSTQDKGATKEIIKIFKESKTPILLTANDAYAQKLKTLRNYCKLVQFNKLNYLSIEKFIKKICDAENIKYKEISLKSIAQRANGDMRAAILDLESIVINNRLIDTSLIDSRDFEENIFNSVRLILKTKKITTAKDVIRNLDRTPEDFFWWIEENVVREYKNNDLIRAIDYLSFADIIRNRITKRQDWSMLRYYIDFISIGVALSKKETYKRYTPYGFPKYIRMRVGVEEPKEIISELGEKMHCSKKVVREELPYIKQFLDEKENQ